MTGLSPQPTSPTEWESYATSDAVQSIPLREAETVDENAKTATFRGVFLEASTVLPSSMSRVNVLADVVAFKEESSTISPARNGTVQIKARVLTAATPVKIVIPSDASGVVAIYAAIVDQPIAVYLGDSKELVLDLGRESEYVGIVLDFDGGVLEYDYEKIYPSDWSENLRASLNTQLRIALVEFWRNTSIAISLCAYVAALTKKSPEFSLLNTQAVALGQQLAGQVIEGPEMKYAPVLVPSRYEITARAIIDAAAAFQEQYERFEDKEESLENHIKAWQTMLSQATGVSEMHKTQRDIAMAKYKNAQETTEHCLRQFKNEGDALVLVQYQFEQGLEMWVIEQKFQAALQIVTAVFSFAVSIGTLVMGNPGGGSGAADAAGRAVKAVQDAERISDQVGKILSSNTLKKLADAINALSNLIPLVLIIVDAVEKFEMDNTIEIPSTDDISGSKIGNADATTIVTLAAWDKWILDVDQQIAFAVENNIDGASDYQLALRKHGINGKQLAQAQAETIKAGYEYVQAQMEVIVSQKQIEELQALLEDYEGQEERYLQAKTIFYDRAMALRTSIVIVLRDMAWAYRYWALAESSIRLDAHKPLADYRSDLATILTEVDNVDSQWASDFQPFEYPEHSESLPADYGPSLTAGLLGGEHTGSFTLLPEGDLANVFSEGSHYRLNGLDATLDGALPNSDSAHDGKVWLKLQITTSGIYADIKEDGRVLYFRSLPQVRRCSYDLDMNGNRLNTRDDPSFETKDHAEPTPFTQWKIKVLNPEDLNLEGLKGVKLLWEGRVRYDEVHRRRQQVEELE
ncbi:uncharacterized protein BDW43DRAFT_310231 [Aspergillus alliaceus]|uniref:uncharacterized protein n=1 Tax=Petromyces alliaceus TaxID=209559 RepID=UPI0012A76E90|nr:uncharacterized protein BDW43DRAFT_310231 [Aspergillus alliaceus]KAB8234569.1 hypothetical protein BDW43DRAFT_310231 [Aspergillus alliaceus]